MNREIKFRGRVLNNGNHRHSGDWVYGYYWTNEVGNHFIRITLDDFENFILEDIEVDGKTIGQYIGLEDKNDQPIYEGDIVKYVYKSKEEVKERIYVVYFDVGCFYCLDKNKQIGSSVGYYTTLVKGNGLKVIGNICEHKELIEKD